MDLRRERKSKSCVSDVDEEDDDRDYFTVSHQSTKKKQSKAKLRKRTSNCILREMQNFTTHRIFFDT